MVSSFLCFSCEKKLGCNWDLGFLRVSLYTIVAVKVGSLPNHVNSCILYVCLLFNFRLFTVINLGPEVLFAQQL